MPTEKEIVEVLKLQDDLNGDVTKALQHIERLLLTIAKRLDAVEKKLGAMDNSG